MKVLGVYLPALVFGVVPRLSLRQVKRILIKGKR